jgi:hypothetical protein
MMVMTAPVHSRREIASVLRRCSRRGVGK